MALLTQCQISNLLLDLALLEGTGVVVQGLVGHLLVHDIGDSELGNQPFGPVPRGIGMSLAKE